VNVADFDSSGTILHASRIAGIVCIRLFHASKIMSSQTLIDSISFPAGFANFLAEDSRLLAAPLMGGAMHPLAKRFNTTLDP
jgi:hypothetical protein